MNHSYINKEYTMEKDFAPNINNSEKLKVIDATSSSIMIQMYNPDCKGVFPSESFQYWIKKGLLIPIEDIENAN